MKTSTWLARCDTAALLASPRLSIPAIRGAVTSTPEGWPRVAAVLRAAMLAVPAGTAGSVLDIVRRLGG